MRQCFDVQSLRYTLSRIEVIVHMNQSTILASNEYFETAVHRRQWLASLPTVPIIAAGSSIVHWSDLLNRLLLIVCIETIERRKLFVCLVQHAADDVVYALPKKRNNQPVLNTAP